MNGLRKVWRESASLLLLSKSTTVSQSSGSRPKFNYEVLVLKRSGGSKFMPNAIVFPGGVIEKSDSSRNWVDLYSKLGVSDAQLGSLKNPRNTDFIYLRSSEEEQIERELSLRITAIRETFEEVGVLLVKSADQLKAGDLFTAAKSDFDLKFWQKEVQGNASRFYDLCQTLQVVPDVFSLSGWSNWLTPTAVLKHRFDAMFFLACIPEKPSLSMDEKEAEHVVWATPENLIASHNAETIWLPPPQLYELGRLNQVQDFDQIAKFSKWRNQFGTTLFFPIFVKAKDTMLHLLPGDDLYPKEPNYQEKGPEFDQYQDKTSEELSNCKNLHRTSHEKLKSDLQMTIVPQNEHLCPEGKSNSIADFVVKAKL